MKKKIKIFTFLLCIMLLSIINVKALNIDEARQGQINIIVEYGNKRFNNLDVFLYKVGDIDTEGMITYIDELTDKKPVEDAKDDNEEKTDDDISSDGDSDSDGDSSDVDEPSEEIKEKIDISKYSASELSNLAKELDKKVKDKNIEPFMQGKTNEQGMYLFNYIPIGMYLLKVNGVTENSYEYTISPQLLLMPTKDEIDDSGYIYDFSSLSKVAARDLRPKGNNGENVPNTFDAIYLYIGIFVVALMGIIIIVYYIKKKSKRKEEKNYEEKEII